MSQICQIDPDTINVWPNTFHRGVDPGKDTAPRFCDSASHFVNLAALGAQPTDRRERPVGLDYTRDDLFRQASVTWYNRLVETDAEQDVVAARSRLARQCGMESQTSRGNAWAVLRNHAFGQVFAQSNATVGDYTGGRDVGHGKRCNWARCGRTSMRNMVEPGCGRTMPEV